MERWFLIDDGPTTGALNMALDEFLLEKVERERSRPILRLYSFDPPAVTIGFHQTGSAGLDRGAIERDGMDLVKRFTGGRALLHEGELTYCIVARTDIPPFDAHLQSSYMLISEALARALRSIGVDASISSGRAPSGPHSGSKPCLDSVSRHEITAGGRKIAASAQRRTRNSFLQHGSILMTPASGRILDYLPGVSIPLSERVTSVSEELGREADPSLLRRAVVRGFEEAFRVSFEILRLSKDEERELAVRRKAKLAGSALPGEREVAV